MEPITWTERPGLADAIYAAGHKLEGRADGLTYTDAPGAVQAIIDGWDDLAAAKAAKLAELAAHRWQVQQGGCDLGGVTFPTDAEARANLAGAGLAAMLSAQLGQTYSAEWKTPGGVVTLDGATIMGATLGLEAWMRGLFRREAELAGEIAAMTDWKAVVAFDVAATF